MWFYVHILVTCNSQLKQKVISFSTSQCEGKHYDAKSDIWALGCILYEMMCLQKTFEGTNLPVLVHKIVEVSFAPVKGDYSDNLKQLVCNVACLPRLFDAYTVISL